MDSELATYIDISLAGRLVEPGIGHNRGSQESWCNTLSFYHLVMTNIAYHIAWYSYWKWPCWHLIHLSRMVIFHSYVSLLWGYCQLKSVRMNPPGVSLGFPAPWMMTYGSPGESLQAVRLQWCQSNINSIPKYPNWPVPSPMAGRFLIGSIELPSGYDQHSHGKSPINGGFHGKIQYKWAILHGYVK